MKKALSLIVACALLLALCACGNAKNQTPDAPQQSESIENQQPAELPAPGELTKPAEPNATGTVEAPTQPEAPAPEQNVVTGPEVSMPELPETPAEPETPDESETPAEPEAPAEPETPIESQEPTVPGEDLMMMIEDIYAICGPQFMHMSMPVDLADADITAWLTGISDPSLLSAAVVNESMMGSQAYSLVLARVADAAKAEEVARMMLDNINPAKWICVQADDMAAAIKGDLVMFIMVDTQLQLTAQSMVDAFAQVAGGVDNTLTK